jgi:HEAT repeat protein
VRTSLILALGLLLQATPKELIDKLRSDRVEERDAASSALKKLDPSAIPLLEAAAKDPDPEVARRAGLAIRIILLRGTLTPGLKNHSPGIEERLAAGTDAAYTAAFLELATRNDLGTADFLALGPAALRGATDRERATVVFHLGARRITSAIPEIRALLRTPDAALGQQAESSLLQMAPQTAQEAFLELLGDARPDLRSRGVQALGRAQVLSAVPRISALISDMDQNVRQNVLHTLATLGARSEIPRIVACLEDPSPLIPSAAAQALVVLDAKEAIPAIAALLNRRERDDDDRIIEVLAGLDAVQAAPAIANRLGSKDGKVRAAAARALTDLDARDDAARILPLLRDEDEVARAAALWAVGRFRLKEAADQVLKLLGDEDADVRFVAAWAAGKLRIPAAVPALLKMLGSNQQDAFASAVWALGELRAKEALPRLTELAASSTSSGLAAAEALSAIGEPLAVADLLKILDSDNRELADLLKPLVRTVPQAEILAALRPGLNSADDHPRQRSLLNVGRLGLSEGAPILIQTLRNKEADPMDRISAAEALGTLSRKEFLPDLLALARDEDFPDQDHAVRLLGLFGTKETLPVLREFLKSEDSDVQEAAILAMETLGLTEMLDPVAALLPKLGGETDVVASAWLCRSGRREGVENLLLDDETLIPINAVRSPAAWKKLAATPYGPELNGSLFDIADRIARDAGLRLSWRWRSGDDDITIRLMWREGVWEGDRKTGAAALEQLFRSNGSWSVVLDDNVLRILPASEAQDIHKTWFESTQKR